MAKFRSLAAFKQELEAALESCRFCYSFDARLDGRRSTPLRELDSLSCAEVALALEDRLGVLFNVPDVQSFMPLRMLYALYRDAHKFSQLALP